MKILCVCRGGNSRSVTCAYLLKQVYGHDALAVSYKYNAPETLRMLCDWADKIVVMRLGIVQRIPAEFFYKILIADVGTDKWFHPSNELMTLICKKLQEAGLVNSAV